MTRPRLTFYTRPNCSLCDKALAELEDANGAAEFDLTEINILEDFEAYQRFKHDVPVLMHGEQILFRHRMTSAELIQRMAELNEK